MATNTTQSNNNYYGSNNNYNSNYNNNNYNNGNYNNNNNNQNKGFKAFSGKGYTVGGSQAISLYKILKNIILKSHK